MIIKIICLLVTLIQITRSDNVFNSTLVFANNETLNSTFSLNDASNVKANHTSNNSSILELNETSTFDLKFQSGKCFI
jgi:hypothetical protein